MTIFSLILQILALALTAYGVWLLYFTLGTLDLIAYGEEEELIVPRPADYDPADDDLDEGFFDVLETTSPGPSSDNAYEGVDL